MKLVATRRYKNKSLGETWNAQCPVCKKWLVRLINDAMNDPYFRLSRKVRGDRKKYANDLLQPGDPGFDLLYPHHKKERERKEEEEAKKQWEQENKKTSHQKKKLIL